MHLKHLALWPLTLKSHYSSGYMDTRLCQLCLLLHFDCFWWQARAEHEPPFSRRPSHLSMKQLNMTRFCKWLHFLPRLLHGLMISCHLSGQMSLVHDTASEDCSGHVWIWELSKSVSITFPTCAMHSITPGTGSGCASWVDWRLGASRGEEPHYKKQTAGHDSWFQWA